MTNEEIVEEILHEANVFGIMKEVINQASQIMQNNPKIERVVAYETAFNELKKNEKCQIKL
jgi:hypothetical protein